MHIALILTSYKKSREPNKVLLSIRELKGSHMFKKIFFELLGYFTLFKCAGSYGTGDEDAVNIDI